MNKIPEVSMRSPRYRVFRCCLCFLGMFLPVRGNPGTEFVLAFPESMNREVQTATILISVDPNGDEIQTLGVIQVQVSWKYPSESWQAVLTSTDPYHVFEVNQSRNLPPGIVGGQQYVAHVQADALVEVEVRNEGKSNNDLYLAIPVLSLGTSHYALSYSPQQSKEASFLVVASTDSSTDVRITLPKSLERDKTVVYNQTVFHGGDSLALSLLPLEAFQIQAGWDLTGTLIESDKVVAVWSGVNRTEVRGYRKSHMTVQTPHLEMDGNQYVFLPVPIDAPYVQMRVLAVQDGANLTIHFYNESIDVYQIASEGDYFKITFSWTTDKCVYLKSNKGVLAYRVASSEDPSQMGGQAMALLSPLTRPSPSSYSFLLGPFKIHSEMQAYVSFVIADSRMDGLLLNGASLQNNPLIQEFTSFKVPGNPDFMVGVIALHPQFDNTVLYVLRHESGYEFKGIIDVVQVSDGESRALGYPLESTNQISVSDSTNTDSKCCIEVDQNGHASSIWYNDFCFDNVFVSTSEEVCCILDYRRVQCKPSKKTYSCSLQNQTKLASNSRFVKSSSTLSCFRACLSDSECVGANYNGHDDVIDNCQILSGVRKGSVEDSSWIFLDCEVSITFDIILS